jgi:hypothetical protein
MVIQVNLNKLFLIINPSSNQISFESSANFEIFFLLHKDKDIETNPIYIPFSNLKELGFRSIAKLG